MTELAGFCNFGTLRDELIRDNLTYRKSIPRVRERLLTEDDTLTLEKASSIAISIESAIKESKAIKATSGTTSTNHSQDGKQIQGVTHKKRRATRSRSASHITCYNCGEKGHTRKSDNCPARGKRCTRCSKPNHFTRVCQSSGGSKTVQNIDQNCTASDEDESPVYILHVGQTGKFKMCDVNIDGHATTLLVDIGAKVSILNDKLYRKNFSHHNLQPALYPLQAYENSKIPVLGIVYLHVSYNGMTLDNFPFYVSTGRSLMGVDLFDMLGFQLHDCNGIYIQTVESNQYSAQYPNIFGGSNEFNGYSHRSQVDPLVKPVSQGL